MDCCEKEEMILKVKKLLPEAIIPTRGTGYAAAFDLYSVEDLEIQNNTFKFINTGIAIEIPEGYCGYIRPRSGKATKEGLALRSSNLIDSDYRGKILIGAFALGVEKLIIKKGERVAQLLILPVPKIKIQEVDELSITERNTGGHGSTGK